MKGKKEIREGVAGMWMLKNWKMSNYLEMMTLCFDSFK